MSASHPTHPGLVLYVSPLKALSNDIHPNLEAPLAGIRDELTALALPDVEIRTAVRTGYTPQSERDALRKPPPHILVTMPGSLHVLPGSESGCATLAGVRTLIVDEIHALLPGKRGSSLSLSLERLDGLVGHRATSVGLLDTQERIEDAARFLVGSTRVDAHGHPASWQRTWNCWWHCYPSRRMRPGSACCAINACCRMRR